jgi:hypothetical protein
LGRPGHQIEVCPPDVVLPATVISLAAIGDARILAGGIQGTRRLARTISGGCRSVCSWRRLVLHWPDKFIPERIRIVPLAIALASARS